MEFRSSPEGDFEIRKREIENAKSKSRQSLGGSSPEGDFEIHKREIENAKSGPSPGGRRRGTSKYVTAKSKTRKREILIISFGNRQMGDFDIRKHEIENAKTRNPDYHLGGRRRGTSKYVNATSKSKTRKHDISYFRVFDFAFSFFEVLFGRAPKFYLCFPWNFGAHRRGTSKYVNAKSKTRNPNPDNHLGGAHRRGTSKYVNAKSKTRNRNPDNHLGGGPPKRNM